MCVVKESVADGICDGGVADVIVPLSHWDLAGKDRGLVPVAILDDLEEISALGFADPDAGVAFAYLMNRPGERWQTPRAQGLIDALADCL